MYRELLAVCRNYDAPPEQLWPVVADLAGYAEHVTGLTSSEVLSGEGNGARRECLTVKGERWTETVTEWQDGRSFEIEVDCDTYPAPLRQVFRRFTASWKVESEGTGSRVCIHFKPDVRGGWLLWPIVKLGARQTRKDLEYTLNSYELAVATV